MNPLADHHDLIPAQRAGLVGRVAGSANLHHGGRTGFFGCWLLESLVWGNNKFGLGDSAVALNREVAAPQTKAPRLASHRAIHFNAGDVRPFEFPLGSFSQVIHPATEASAKLNEEVPLRRSS